jgi:DNA-binding transcriptional LysR family regulator
MTLEQLRIFVAVAELEHVTRAAERLNLTQSAVSAAVSALENRYATRLFDRVGRGIRLSDAGRAFLVEARAVLARASVAETVLADLAGMRRGSLTLAASQTVANYWLPALICHFQQRYPGIETSLFIGNTEQVAARVAEGEADLGFVEGEVEAPQLTLQPAAEDELVLVVGPRHEWVQRDSFSKHDLPHGRWVLREPGSGTRAMFLEAIAGLGLDADALDIALELPSNEAVRSAVEAGAGASVMSRLVVDSAIRAGKLVELPLTLPRRRFLALSHKERYRTAAQREFLAIVTAIAAEGHGI